MIQYLTLEEAAEFGDEMISPLRGRRVMTVRGPVKTGWVIKSFWVHSSKRVRADAFVMVRTADNEFFITRVDNITRDD